MHTKLFFFFEGLQVDLQPRVRSIGTQFNGIADVSDHPVIIPKRYKPVQIHESSSSGESETETHSSSAYEPSSASSSESRLTDTPYVTDMYYVCMAMCLYLIP
jgi:hypothetical protein